METLGFGQVKEFTILRTIRLLRLTRLGRIARLLRAVPEVVTLLKARGRRYPKFSGEQ